MDGINIDAFVSQLRKKLESQIFEETVKKEIQAQVKEQADELIQE